MQNRTERILSSIAIGAVTAGWSIYAVFNKKREEELYCLNNELYLYGHPGFEPNIDNARAKVTYARKLIEEAATNAQFEAIINFNQMS